MPADFSITNKRATCRSLARLACAGFILVASPKPAAAGRPLPCASGHCIPKRDSFGYYAPQWRRWPGATREERPEQEPVGVESDLPKVEPPAAEAEGRRPAPPLPTRTEPASPPGEQMPALPETPAEPAPGANLPGDLPDGQRQPAAPGQLNQPLDFLRPGLPKAAPPANQGTRKPPESGSKPTVAGQRATDGAGRRPTEPVPPPPSVTNTPAANSPRSPRPRVASGNRAQPTVASSRREPDFNTLRTSRSSESAPWSVPSSSTATPRRFDSPPQRESFVLPGADVSRRRPRAGAAPRQMPAEVVDRTEKQPKASAANDPLSLPPRKIELSSTNVLRSRPPVESQIRPESTAPETIAPTDSEAAVADQPSTVQQNLPADTVSLPMRLFESQRRQRPPAPVMTPAQAEQPVVVDRPARSRSLPTAARVDPLPGFRSGLRRSASDTQTQPSDEDPAGRRFGNPLRRNSGTTTGNPVQPASHLGVPPRWKSNPLR